MKRGAKGFCHAERGGGDTKRFRVVLTQDLEVLALKF